MSSTIRRADPADAPWLAALAERTFRETYTAHNTPEDMEHYVAGHFGPDRQADELRDPATTTLVAEEGGQAAGYVQLGGGPAPASVCGPDPMEVVRFYVDRPWHGRGVAQRLMAAAADAARAAGARTLWLGVWERNERAIAFYRKCGFHDVGTQLFVLGSDRQRDRVLERSPL
ncbi:MAG TPA: GNAT family N-acetyltransferase [Gemmatimonadales bacterium]|nr:GNAT family N-acetyltransferase [Gemmatimonadales bacterium]